MTHFTNVMILLSCFKFDANFSSHPNCDEVVVTKFCTWYYYRYALVVCAKTCVAIWCLGSELLQISHEIGPVKCAILFYIHGVCQHGGYWWPGPISALGHQYPVLPTILTKMGLASFCITFSIHMQSVYDIDGLVHDCSISIANEMEM